MADEQNHKEAETVLQMAGINVPQPRIAAISFAVVGTKTQLQAISRYDYGTIEPASRFQAPR